MNSIKTYGAGLALTAVLGIFATYISDFIPYHLISAGVFALLIGMAFNPLVVRASMLRTGIGFVSKQVLRLAIILMGATLSFTQVLEVGRFSLFVMCFTLATAFGGGYLLGKVFKMDWKLSGLISAGTGICGGSAIAAIAPVIDAPDKDIAYAISATFLFDILMVILFPIAGRYFGMSDMGYGLWAGTAVNDTSSVVAAGYAFSDAAGAYSVIVKLTRTLSIIPTVMVFSFINARCNAKAEISDMQVVAEATGTDGPTAMADTGGIGENRKRKAIGLRKIFPYFILLFLLMVALKSMGLVPASASGTISSISKFLMVMALGAIGLKTNFKEVATSGWKPMLHGFLISALVVVVAFLVQMMLGQM
ncbi:MAG: YeiH family protein [Sphaerochaetaceae bacterium]|jgi:uncharacterized integral membrane protein (TIGR00698 family)